MKKLLQKLTQIDSSRFTLFEKVWLLAPIAIWFSYRPLLTFGQNASTNFEASPTLLYIVVLALCGIPLFWKNRKTLWCNTAVRLVTSFMVLSAVSIVWSSNITRGVLTIGVMGALYLILLATIAERKRFQKLLPTLVKLYIVSAVIMSLAAFIQVFAGIWTQGRGTLLCRGCVATQFGFSRPNVFTIEPQFLGNLLLIPALILAYILFQKKQNRLVSVGLFIIATALFLTLSRGAIFACVIGLIIIVFSVRPKMLRLANIGSLFLAGLVTCLVIQGTTAVLNPRISTTFRGAVSASINQLSLGVIDLQAKQPTGSVLPAVAPQAQTPTAKVTPVFTGYVEESTNVRLKLSKLALRSWKKSPERMVFGVGLGGSGVTLRNDFPDQVNQHEIVQNEFAEVLLENGIIGLILLTTILVGLLYTLRDTKWLWAIVVAFLVQWNFFSGYPNALHMYLVLIWLFVIGVSVTDKASKTG